MTGGALLAASFFCCFLSLPAETQSKPKLPPAVRLDLGVELRRDPATGELQYSRRTKDERAPRGNHAAGKDSAEKSSAPATIRVRVSLVEVNANVLLPDGNHVPGLERGDFRLYENGTEQAISYFDASTEPASIALVLDVSPSVFHEWSAIQKAARTLAQNLGPRDEVAVITLAGYTKLLLPFTADRALFDHAIRSAQVDRSEGDARGSEIYRSVYLAAEELFSGQESRHGRKAIVLLTDGQDSGLGLSWDAASAAVSASHASNRLTFEDVCRALAATGAEVYVVSTQNRPAAMTPAWLTAHRQEMLVSEDARRAGMTHYTLYLAELVRRAGGRLLFLHEEGTLAEAWQQIAKNLRAQYTLGYYPQAGARSGWRTLRVELVPREGVPVAAVVRHRVAYYSPSAPH